MEIKDEDVPFKLLCTACLCVGRKLHTLRDEKNTKLLPKRSGRNSSVPSVVSHASPAGVLGMQGLAGEECQL